MAARVIVNLPASAKRGEIIEIRTLAGHAMETGFRRTQLGELVPRDIITGFSCSYNGVEVFRAELHPAVAANPLIVFTTVAAESGTLAVQSRTLPHVPRTPYTDTSWGHSSTAAGDGPSRLELRMLHRLGSNRLPQAKDRPSTPRLAFSHSLSVGSRTSARSFLERQAQ